MERAISTMVTMVISSTSPVNGDIGAAGQDIFVGDHAARDQAQKGRFGM
jgi:hypothetical protein